MQAEKSMTYLTPVALCRPACIHMRLRRCALFAIHFPRLRSLNCKKYYHAPPTVPKLQLLVRFAFQ